MRVTGEALSRRQHSRRIIDAGAAERARPRFRSANRAGLIVSDFAAAEFVSAVARRVRTRETTIEDARRDIADFEAWAARSSEQIKLSAGDVAVATAYLRRLDLTLLAPDALHIAMTQRIEATLVTFDRGMAAAARSLGTAIVTP